MSRPRRALALTALLPLALALGACGAPVPEAPENPIEGDPLPNQGGPAAAEDPDTGSTLGQEVPNPQPDECEHGALETTEQADLVEVLRQAGDFTVLVELIAGSDLADRLAEDGPFTLLAPTDEAFAALPPGLLDVYRENPQELDGLLRNHVLAGACTPDDLRAAGSAPTLGGQDVEFAEGAAGLEADEAAIAEPGLQAANGVAYGIGSVLLLPPVPEEGPTGVGGDQFLFQGLLASATDDEVCVRPQDAATPVRCFALGDAELPPDLTQGEAVQVRYVRRGDREIALAVAPVLD